MSWGTMPGDLNRHNWHNIPLILQGLRSKTHVVLVSFKRAQSELANHQLGLPKVEGLGKKYGKKRNVLLKSVFG